MRLNFLCPRHRRALTDDPAAARSLWLEVRQRLDAQPAVATPYSVNLAGSALEAAGLYLQANPVCEPAALDRYAESALHLVGLLVQLRETRLAFVVVAGANAMVEQLARCGADVDAALAACRRLTIEGVGRIEGAATPSRRLSRVPVHALRTTTLH